MTSKFIASSITVKGKPIKKSFQNALTKAQSTYLWSDKPAGIRKNSFTGLEEQLNELEASIYDWIMGWYRAYEYGKLITPPKTYDDMRYLFLELNPTAYYNLID